MNNDINNQEKNTDDLSEILTEVKDTTLKPYENELEKIEVEKLEDKQRKKEDKIVQEDRTYISKEKLDPEPEPKKLDNNNFINQDRKEEPKKEIKKKFPIGTYLFLFVSIIFLGVSSFFFYKFVINANEIPVRKIRKNSDEQTITNVKIVQIYSANKSLDKLTLSEVEITSEDFSSEAEATFENIKNKNNYKVKGEDGKYWQFMDPSIKLLNSYVVGDKIYLNISSNLVDNIHNNKQELLVLYSIINTFTALDNIKHVKILINNKEVDKLKWYSLKTFYSENHDL